LTELGASVALVAAQTVLAPEMAPPRRWRAVHLLKEHGVARHYGARLVAIERDRIHFPGSDGAEQELAVDTVVLSDATRRTTRSRPRSRRTAPSCTGSATASRRAPSKRRSTRRRSSRARSRGLDRMREGPELDRALVRASGLALLFALCLLFWPTAQRRVFVYGDLGNFFLPIRLFLADELAHGRAPLWIPHLFCGFYIHGEGQIGAFHPLRWLLYRYAPFSEAFNLECITAYPLAAIGVALFMRRLALPASAALFGGISFGLSAYLTVRLTHLGTITVLAHLGFLLFALDVLLCAPRGRTRALAWLGVALLTGSQLLAGYPPALIYSLLLEIAYLVFVAASRREWLPAVYAGGALGTGFLLGAVQVFPTLDLLSTTWRANPSLDYLTLGGSLDPQNLLLALAPWLYAQRTWFERAYDPIEQVFYFGAVVPLAALWVLVRWKRLGPIRPLVAGSLALSGLTLLAALGRHTDLYRLIAALPVLGILRVPARYLLIPCFTGSLLAAVAFADLLAPDTRHARRERWLLWLVPAASLSIAILALALRADPHGPAQAALAARLADPRWLLLSPLLFTCAAALFFAAARGSRAALFGLVLFSLADLSSYAASLWWSDPPRTIADYREHLPYAPVAPPSRLATLFNAKILTRPDGLPLFWANTSMIVHGVRLVSGYAAIDPATRLDLRKIASLRVAGASAALGDGGIEDLPGALPRVRLVASAVASADPNAEIDRIDVATTALVEHPVDLVAGPPGEAELEEDLPGSIRIATRSQTRQLLLLSESFHPGWQVAVDGTPRSVVRTYGDFLGCVVDAGSTTCASASSRRATGSGAS
jgi:hypothetical protein